MSLHAVCRRLGVVLCLALAAACGASSTMSSVGPDPGGEAMLAADPGGVTVSAWEAFPPAVNEALLDVLQLEYQARATYESVMVRFGEVRPFVEVEPAEDMHIDRLVELYLKRELDAPQPESFVPPTFMSLAEACEDAVSREVQLGQSYQAFVEADCPRDVWRVVTHLADASLESHLPAFENCATRE